MILREPGEKTPKLIEIDRKMRRLKRYLSQSVQVVSNLKNGEEIGLSVLFGKMDGIEARDNIDLYETLSDLQDGISELKSISIELFKEKGNQFHVQ